MKGLILKDIYAFIKSGRYFMIVVLCYTILAGATGNSLMFAFAAIFMATLPVSMMGMDEKINWDSYAVMLPVSRKDIVLSKYVIGVGGVACALIFCMVVGYISALISGQPYSLGNELTSLLPMFAAASIFVCINLPIMFKTGAEKGRLLYFLSMGAVAVFIIVAGKIAESNNAVMESIMGIMPMNKANAIVSCGLQLLVTFLLLYLSFRISLGIFRKKEV